eukprot:2778594-Pyramimonas_sp.AAC.1
MNPFTDRDARWRVEFDGDLQLTKSHDGDAKYALLSNMGIQCHALSAGCRDIRIASPHVSPDLLEAAHRGGMSMSERLRREKSTLLASGAVDHE